LCTLALALFLLPAAAGAHPLSAAECREGGDFIQNAALARDAGMREEQFMNRVQEDLELIKSFPPHLRWFVQDEDDAEFLIAAAADVFQKPKAAAAHRTAFVAACLGKDGRLGSERL
jgi:hypothetical protein